MMSIAGQNKKLSLPEESQIITYLKYKKCILIP